MNDTPGTRLNTGERPLATLPLRVLVTAQPFGFGPAAAMAQVFDHLRPRVRFLAFAGAGHTCDIHMRLPYDAVHRLPADDGGEAFGRLCAGYDASLIACDFSVAEAARAAGIPFGIYDPIPWFWPRWPSVVESAALYMCQDFFGVRELVRDAGRKTVVVVPPVLPSFPRAAEKRSRHVLVNLGGLRNPFQSQEDSAAYARLVTAIVPGVARLYPAVHVATSQSIAESLQHNLPAARTVSPREAQHLLGTGELAVMTPGLGNIYEAAALARRVFWLPPANNSHGQQLDMLRRRGLAPFAADWHDLLPARAPIDYCAAEPTAMKHITDAIHEASEDPTAAERLWALFFQAHRAPATPNPLTQLLEQFGTGGARVVAESFVQRVLAPLARAAGKQSHP
jgi:hypothetical protein